MPTQPSVHPAVLGSAPSTGPPWMAADASSSTSHNTASSRLPASPTLLPHQQPLSLADALARDGIHGDITAALDAVLAERNKLCLEVAKLTGENVRIWHLLGRIRKDNDSLRARVGELGSAVGAAPASASGSARRRGTKEDITAVGAPAVPLSATVGSSMPTPSHSDQTDPNPAAASSSRDILTDTSTSALLATQGAALSSYLPRSPLSQSSWSGTGTEDAKQFSADVVPSESTSLGASNGEVPTSSSSVAASVQQSSIMQQRLAAQVLAQSRAHGSRPGGERAIAGGPDLRASMASQDFVAIEGSGSEDEGTDAPLLSGDVVIDPVAVPSSAERSSVAPATTSSEVTPAESASMPAPQSEMPPSLWNAGRHGSQSYSTADDDVSLTQHRYQQEQAHQRDMPSVASFPQQLPQQQQSRTQYSQQPNFPPAQAAYNAQDAGLPQDSHQIATRPSNGQTSASVARRREISSSGSGSGSVDKSAASGRGGAFGFAFAPWLDLATLGRTQIRVVRSNIKTNERGKENITFHVSIRVFAPSSSSAGPSEGTGIASEQVLSSWLVDKAFTDVVNLDARLRQKHGRSGVKRMADAMLPDKALFKDHAPSKVDARKAALEAYLMTLVMIELPDKDDLITFLCTDVITPPRPHDPLSLMKEGHLTKKGQNLGRWVTRWYSLRGSRLEYFEAQGGVHLGGINIHGAQIGRQQKTPVSEADENSYRHAFLLLEKRIIAGAGTGATAGGSPNAAGSGPGSAADGASQLVRHVLCAESDMERDEWVEVLVRAIAELERQSRRSAKAAMNGAGAGGASGGGGSSADSSSRRKQSDSLSRRARNQSANGRAGGPDVDPTSGPSTAGYLQHGISGSTDNQDFPNGAVGPAPPTMPSSPPLSNRGLQDIGRLQDKRGMSLDQPPHQSSSELGSLGNEVHHPSSEPRERSNSLNTTTSGIASSPSMASSATTYRTGARPSISGPMNGTPIPTGYKFGAKEDPPSSGASGGASGGGIGSGASDMGSSGSPQGMAGGKSNERDKKRFWHRFGGGAEKNSRHEPRPVFGVSLSESIAISSCAEGLALPSVVYRCIEYLEKRNAATEEGIYRLSGSTAVIKALKDRFNTEGDVDLLAADHEHDPHAIAGLLKTFLRELPVNVLTGDLYRDFMRVNDLGDRKERVNELGQLVCMLPLPNYTLLRVLCSHFIKIIEHSDVNKMTMRNVGIVFSPTLGIPGGLFALFLTEFDWVFYTDAQGDPAPRHMEEDILPPDAEELGNTRADQSYDHEGPSSGVPSTTGSIAEETSRYDDNGSLGPLTSRSGNRNAHRTSFVAGGTLSNMANVMSGLHSIGSSNTAPRNKRNSLRYNEAEADRILGLHGRRLSTHIDEAGGEGYEDDLRDVGAVAVDVHDPFAHDAGQRTDHDDYQSGYLQQRPEQHQDYHHAYQQQQYDYDSQQQQQHRATYGQQVTLQGGHEYDGGER